MWDFLLGFSCWDILWDFSAWDFPAGIFSGILQLGFFAGIFVSDILETSTLKHEIFWDISITLVTETQYPNTYDRLAVLNSNNSYSNYICLC